MDHWCTELVVDDDGRVFLGCAKEGGFELLRLDGSSWQSVGRLAAPDVVYDLALGAGGTIWLAGGSGGELTSTGFIARWNGTAIEKLEQGFDSYVVTLDTNPDDRGQLLVGGSFTSVSGHSVRGVAHWNGADWESIGAGVEGAVRTVEYGRGGFYASTIGDVHSVMRWDGSQWTNLATSAHQFPAIAEFDAAHLRELGSGLLVAGAIYTDDPEAGRNAYFFDGTSFAPLGGNVATSFVSSVGVTTDGLWLGGPIAEVGGPDAVIPSVGVARLRWAAP